ncbi:MAG: hypothetical protein CL510_10205 [Actinobacteria bacterium]|nr:hypothetical protein [Actinomycetota bacterium]
MKSAFSVLRKNGRLSASHAFSFGFYKRFMLCSFLFFLFASLLLAFFFRALHCFLFFLFIHDRSFLSNGHKASCDPNGSAFSFTFIPSPDCVRQAAPMIVRLCCPSLFISGCPLWSNS